MDKLFVDDLASRMARQFAKLTSPHHRTVKWEKLPASDRGHWRLIARMTIAIVVQRLGEDPALVREDEIRPITE